MAQKPPSGSRHRAAVRVKTAKHRTVSSTAWLRRQLNDPYVAEARRLGYRSRAAFKLIELDDRFHFLKRGGRIVDLGAAPGGWSQVAATRIGAAEGKGLVVAVDVLAMEAVPGVAFLALDFLSRATPAAIEAELRGKADVVMSDMAQPATGHGATDHLRIVALAEAALGFCRAGAGPRRQLHRQGVPGRCRGRIAGGVEARLHDGAPRKAAGEPGRVGRGLCRGPWISSRVWAEGFPWRRGGV